MYYIVCVILLISSFFIGGGYKFIAMVAAAGLFAIADALIYVGTPTREKKNNKK